jgi:hypothetical protein
MKALVFCLFLAIPTMLFGQKSPVKFGTIPIEDMTMTSYAKDSSAAAVVLVDYGEAYVDVSSFKMNFERHVRIKILKTEGFHWADVAIRYYRDGDRINSLKAATYNLENGKIVATEVTKDNIFKGKFNRSRDVTKFTFPAVKAGSVIEYKFTLSSDDAANFPNWEFQRSIPIRHSEYWALIPDFFIYEKYMQGYLSCQYNVEKKGLAGQTANGHHWIVKDAPAFIEEPFMTSENDYISRINFALSHVDIPGQPIQEIMGSWAKLNEQLLENQAFWRSVKGSGFLKDDVATITAGITDPTEKIKAIHAYVRTNIEWDGEQDYYADALKKILEQKKGTSGDINILLASMLDKAGFDLDLVLLSTRDHGFVRKPYPMRRQFNYVVCAVRLADKTILLDGTEKFLPMGILPPRCLNGEGLVISKDRHGWMNLETKTKARTVTSADFSIDAAGLLKGKMSMQRTGYDAISMRNRYTAKGEETYVKDFLKNKTWEVEKSEFTNMKELDAVPVESHELSISDHASVAGDVIYVNPFVISSLSNNPFTQETRLYPVDYGPLIEDIYMLKLNVPEGFKTDELPTNKALALPNNAAKFMYNVIQNGNVITVTRSFQVNRSIFGQEDYAALKEFYNQVVAKHAEQIVFKKLN